MFETATLLLFVGTTLAFQTTPGPDMLMLIGRGIGQGTRTALYCALGFTAAGIIQIPALAFGLATLFQASPFAYALLKTTCAGYLIYIGLKMLKNSSAPIESAKVGVASPAAAFQQGFIANLTNPKIIIFMLALLPQFADPTRGPVWIQLIILGIIMKATGLLVNICVAGISGSVGRVLMHSARFIKWQQRCVGSLMIAFGLHLLFDSRKLARV